MPLSYNHKNFCEKEYLKTISQLPKDGNLELSKQGKFQFSEQHSWSCPITHEFIMNDEAVIIADGQVYSLSAILKWFNTDRYDDDEDIEDKKNTSPMTGAKLTHREVTPALEFIRKRQEEMKKEKVASYIEFEKAVQKPDFIALDKMKYPHAYVVRALSVTPFLDYRIVYYFMDLNVMDFNFHCFKDVKLVPDTPFILHAFTTTGLSSKHNIEQTITIYDRLKKKNVGAFDLTMEDGEGNSLFTFCLNSLKLDMINYLLKDEKVLSKLNQIHPLTGKIPWYSCTHRSMSAIMTLLANGANPYTRDKFGRNWVASFFTEDGDETGNYFCLEYMLTRFPSLLESIDNDNKSLIWYALDDDDYAKNGFTKLIIDKMIEHKDSKSITERVPFEKHEDKEYRAWSIFDRLDGWGDLLKLHVLHQLMTPKLHFPLSVVSHTTNKNTIFHEYITHKRVTECSLLLSYADQTNQLNALDIKNSSKKHALEYASLRLYTLEEAMKLMDVLYGIISPKKWNPPLSVMIDTVVLEAMKNDHLHPILLRLNYYGFFGMGSNQDEKKKETNNVHNSVQMIQKNGLWNLIKLWLNSVRYSFMEKISSYLRVFSTIGISLKRPYDENTLTTQQYKQLLNSYWNDLDESYKRKNSSSNTIDQLYPLPIINRKKWHEELKITKLLTKRCKDIRDGETPLLWAARHNLKEMSLALLQFSAEDIGLDVALEYPHTMIPDIFRKHGWVSFEHPSRGNQEDGKKITALCFFVMHGHVEAIKLCLQKKPNTKLGNPLARSFLYVDLYGQDNNITAQDKKQQQEKADSYHHLLAVEPEFHFSFRPETSTTTTTSTMSLLDQNVALVSTHFNVERKVPTETKESKESKETKETKAIIDVKEQQQQQQHLHPNAEISKLLYLAGAPLTVDVLHAAVQTTSLSAVQFVVEELKLNIQSYMTSVRAKYYLRLVLKQAVEDGSDDILKYLFKLGLDPKGCIDEDESIPSLFFMPCLNQSIICTLSSFSSGLLDINHKDQLGYTALHRMALCTKHDHHESLIMFLIEGADPNVENFEKKTVLTDPMVRSSYIFIIQNWLLAEQWKVKEKKRGNKRKREKKDVSNDQKKGAKDDPKKDEKQQTNNTTTENGTSMGATGTTTTTESVPLTTTTTTARKTKRMKFN